MSKHSRNDGRQPEQYARLSESPSEDESDEEFRQFCLLREIGTILRSGIC